MANQSRLRLLAIIATTAYCFEGMGSARAEPVAATQNNQSAIRVDADFPGGNGIVRKIDGDVVAVDCDRRDSNWNLYWCFRVRGAAGRTLDVQIGRSAGFTPSGPAYSFDGGKIWQWLGSKTIKGATFQCTVPAGVDEVRFSSVIPYTEENLRTMLAPYRDSANLKRDVLCKTDKGREVEVLYAGRIDGKAPHALAIVARHHACETMASFVLEGFLAAVLADSESGRWYRENVELLVVPFVDKDGVEAGDQGKERRPHDHNRDYEESIYPSVKAIKELLPKWSRERLRLALDLHCPTIGERRIYFVDGPDADINLQVKRLTDLLEKGRKGPLAFRTADTIPFGKGWNNKPGQRSFKKWASTIPGKPVATTIEVAYGAVGDKPTTPDNLRAFGADLAEAFRRFVENRPDRQPEAGK